MDEKTKYLTILIISVVVTAATTYAATLTTFPTARAEDIGAIVDQQMAEQLAPRKIDLSFSVDFFAAGDSLVQVRGDVTLDNLTIIYKYTKLSDRAVIIESVEYGTFIPAWGAGVIIVGGEMPEFNYKIPENIVAACSTTKVNENDCIVFDVWPQLEVMEVYGFA